MSLPPTITTPAAPPFAGRRGLVILTGTWLAAVAIGFWAMWSYAATPGATALPPPSWPNDSSLQYRPGGWTLVLFLHPRCPCSRSTLAELERLQARVADRIDIQIAFIEPAGVDAAFTHSDLWQRAAALPGAMLYRDGGGREHLRFRAHTSGEALLYAPTGRLAYHGGITPARGHEGANPGSDAILSLVGQRPVEVQPTAVISRPTFGCPLEGAASLAPKESS